MEYNFKEIEKKWQQKWLNDKTFKTDNHSDKPKYYVLDMFPYPSGSGLHVGHPLGYIASDIYARYMRLKGYNVLHPMGYDAYGLPAEQYAIQTGQHPAITTETNIKRYRAQLDKLGLSFDWDRIVRTDAPAYYKWTQWVFLQLFSSYYCYDAQQARPVSELIDCFKQQGTKDLNIASTAVLDFTAEQWNKKTEKEQQEILMNYRLAYLSDSIVNWCSALGTVLANDEVVGGVSVRGGHPVERKLMKQWSLRITAYAERLLKGLETLSWSDSLKEIQRNWIGRSEGASIRFAISGHADFLEIFTTRPDTVFGVSFMVLSPEHELNEIITTNVQKESVEAYISWAKNRSERERQAEVKMVTGVFTGAFAVHPFTGEQIPIWISDYVLAGYGTGAIMAVPAHDSRDFAFARHFNLPVTQVIVPKGEQPEDTANWEESKDGKEGTCINSDFINEMPVKNAISAVIKKIEELNIGYGTVNYRLRDAIFSRQRYWGEPFPIYYKEGIPYPMAEKDLPLQLPDIDKYLPTETGEPPLARAKNWTYNGYPLDCNTMPGFAGSNGYYLRYMEPDNKEAYVGKQANEYWGNVDLYMGGAEHATGHLLYARMWNKFLFDLGIVSKDEPFQKLINQGMIQGRTSFVYRERGTNRFISLNLKNNYQVDSIRVDINLVDNDILDIEQFKNWRSEFADAEFVLENGKYICGYEIEKMSKSYYNVQNPDNLVEKYGADTLRMYEMFLGPLEQSKPWNVQGIEGTARFIRKFWKLYHYNDENNFCISEDVPSLQELKILHKTIKKIQEDIEGFSFNTSVSAFMICVNELTELKSNKRAILEPLCILISSFAPHIAEELWQLLGNKETISYTSFPLVNEEYLQESTVTYPVSFNGKTRFMLEIDVHIPVEEIEALVLQSPEAQRWIEGKTPKKVIVVPKKIINIVI
ncbi:MAG: leucine--tRNA ligase [Bacteroidales bacterium]|jgi:leucyl-tRNA synthetase|nr:leucine--tRNA ligase [Bacteroidales bacterium]